MYANGTAIANENVHLTINCDDYTIADVTANADGSFETSPITAGTTLGTCSTVAYHFLG